MEVFDVSFFVCMIEWFRYGFFVVVVFLKSMSDRSYYGHVHFCFKTRILFQISG